MSKSNAQLLAALNGVNVAEWLEKDLGEKQDEAFVTEVTRIAKAKIENRAYGTRNLTKDVAASDLLDHLRGEDD